MSVSNADHHVQVVIDLLEAADAEQWTPDTPDIRNYWDDSSVDPVGLHTYNTAGISAPLPRSELESSQ